MLLDMIRRDQQMEGLITNVKLKLGKEKKKKPKNVKGSKEKEKRND